MKTLHKWSLVTIAALLLTNVLWLTMSPVVANAAEAVLENATPYITTHYLTNATVDAYHEQPIVSLDDNKWDSLTLTSTRLPQGLTLGRCTTMTANTRRRLLCYISGTPKVAGLYPVTLTITDNQGASSSKNFTLKVKPEPNAAPYITTAYLTNATVGTVYSQPIVSMDENQTDTLTLTSTPLPQGLSLGTCTSTTANDKRRMLCYISGTPVVAGTYTVTLTVTDNRGLSSSKTYSLKVNPAVVVLQPTIETVAVAYCGSTSCAHITTVQVQGTNYDANARVEVKGQTDGLTYAGQLVGGNMDTSIITDFSNLLCQVYDVRVYFTTDTREAIKTGAFTPPTCI